MTMTSKTLTAKQLKNKKQLRVSTKNDTLAEQLMLEYQATYGRRMDWTYFGNLLIEKGIATVKREMRSGA